MNRFAGGALAAMFLAGCGGGGGFTPPPAGPSITETRTLTGTARPTGANSCGGDSFDFEAREGTVAVTLVQSTGGLMVQVCGGGIDNNDCTINLMPIGVGQTLTGARRGVSQQNLKPLGLDCVRQGATPPGPVDYTMTLTFQR